MVQARIYRPSKTAMQSGKGRSRQWVLEYTHQRASFIDPIMGWNGSDDTLHQLKIIFNSLEAAIDFAKSKNINVEVESAHSANFIPKSYADNFRSDRVI